MPAECPRAQMLHVLTRVLDLHLRVGAGDLHAMAMVGELAKLLALPRLAPQEELRPAAEQDPGAQAEGAAGEAEGGHGISKCASAYALA